MGEKTPEAAYKVNLEEAVERYADMVYRTAMTVTRNDADANDVFQETFLRLVKYRDTIESEEHLKAWLLRVTANCAKSLVTDTWNKRTQGLDEALKADETMENRGQGAIFEQIRRLPANYSMSLYLYYYEEYSIKEIARITNHNINTVKSYLKRGKELLRRQLVKEGLSI